jgi:hypothetical protein
MYVFNDLSDKINHSKCLLLADGFKLCQDVKSVEDI